jgi:hypothetical protein
MCKQNKFMTIAGWVIAVLLAALFLMSAYFKFFPMPGMAEISAKMGYNSQKMLVLGILEAGAVLLLFVPRIWTLGAVILTGYVGGIIATHLPKDEPIWLPIVLGILVWVSLFLRDGQIRALLPWKCSAATPEQTSNNL